MKKKNFNSKGFTLIELLAVITIMGILMLVAIPAVSRTIENSRRDTFADTATAYINSLINLIAADEVKCSTAAAPTDVNTLISSAVQGDYYMNIDTRTTTEGGDNKAHINAVGLLETGGKSSWSNAHIRGYIHIKKTISSTNKTSYVYTVKLVDQGNHGTDLSDSTKEVGEGSVIKRKHIVAAVGGNGFADTGTAYKITGTATSLICEVEE